MRKVECTRNFLTNRDAQGYVDLSDLDLTGCRFEGDVVSKMSFLSSNLQHVTSEHKEIGDCSFTTAVADNVVFRCRHSHNVIFIKASSECIDFNKNILDTADFSQSQLGRSNFHECQIRNSNSNDCYLYASRFIRAEFPSAREMSFIKLNLTAVMFDYVRMSTGNFKDYITEQLELTIDYSDIFWNEDLDGYISSITKMIDTSPDNATILKSVLAVKLVIQLKILNIANRNFIENMKKIFSHCPYIKDPIVYSYIHSDEDSKFDDFMRQRRLSEVNFDTQQMIDFINGFSTSKWLIDENNDSFIQLIGQVLRPTDDMIKADVWHLYEEWIHSDDVSPIFIKTEDNLRTFNTNELARSDNIFILFSSVDDGPVMVISSQRLHDMLNPTGDTNQDSTYIYESRHKMLPVNLTQEILFSSKSHGKYALFPIFTTNWRAHHIMGKGVQVKENITVPGILDGDAPTVALASTGINKA